MNALSQVPDCYNFTEEMNLRRDFKYCFKDKVSMYWSYELFYQMAISGCQVNPFTARKTCQVVKAWKWFLLIISPLLPFSSPSIWLLPNYSLQHYQNVFHFYLTWSWWESIWTNSATNAVILCQRSHVDVLLPQVLSRPKEFARKLCFEMRACLFVCFLENINFLLHCLTFRLLRVASHNWAFICFMYISYFSSLKWTNTAAIWAESIQKFLFSLSWKTNLQDHNPIHWK